MTMAESATAIVAGIRVVSTSDVPRLAAEKRELETRIADVQAVLDSLHEDRNKVSNALRIAERDLLAELRGDES